MTNLNFPKIIHAVNFLTEKLKLQNCRSSLAVRVLFKKSERCSSIGEAIDLCCTIFSSKPLAYLGWRMKPFQIKSELETLLKILKKRNIKRLMEIGSANGGTFWLFSRVVEIDATLISLDLPGGDFGGGYQEIQVPFFSSFCLTNQRVFCIRNDSHSSKTLEEINRILAGQKLDFLFIDGDHTYEGVKQDFLMYHSLVNKGGLIGFHDIMEGPPELVGGVSRFWNETKTKYEHQEIIENCAQKGYGIGLLFI